MIAYRGIPQVEVIPIRLSDGAVCVSIANDARTPNSAAVDAAWAKLVASNPRYFDGPILSVVHLPHEALAEAMHDAPEQSRRGEAPTDTPRFEVLARRDRFARLAVQPSVATGVRILSVTAALLARDASRREWVMLGRRSRATRVYGGMWELAPSGGLHDPPAAIRSLDHDAILSHLADEVMEEAGLHVTGGQAVAIARDHKAMSDDIVFACDVGSLEDAGARAHAANWEYDEVRWIATDSIAPFDALHEHAIIPPTRALFRGFGWIAE
jgi:hypothetical protein